MRRSGNRRAGALFGRFRLIGVLVAASLVAVGAAAQEEEEELDFDLEIEEDSYDEQTYRELTRYANQVELGFLYNHTNDEIFGNYTGLLDEQFYVLGNVDVLQRDLFGRGDDWYARLRALNLGLESRFIDAEAGRQGRFGVFFEYDKLPVFRSETTQSFFLGLGGDNLTLPDPWTPGATGLAMPELQSNLRTYDVAWDRERFSGGASLGFLEDFEIDLRYDHEKKEGRWLSGSAMGLNGGNARAVVIPAPIDYETQQIEATLRYQGDDFQGSLGYYGSGFNDRNDALRWRNPYTAVTTAESPFNPWGSLTAGYDCDQLPVPAPDVPTPDGCGSGRKQLPPDNWFHQILASGGVNLPYRTRVTLSTAFGWMLQNEDFLPYSVNENLVVTTPLPRNDLDGEIFSTVLGFRVASRPLERLRLDLDYRYDDRNNDTPRDTYDYIRGDAEDQPVGEARINRPYSYTQHRIDFDAGYRVWRRTDLSLGYEWKHTDRDFQEVEELTENTLEAALVSQPVSFLGARLGYSHAWRNGDDYVGNRPFLEGQPASQVPASPAGCDAAFSPSQCPFENHPLLRKSYLANRERDELTSMFTLLPREDLTVGLFFNFAEEDYHDSELGITDTLHWSPGLDLSFAPGERFAAHAFYTYQHFETKQNGWQFAPIMNNPVPEAIDPDLRWSVRDIDRTHTVGAGFEVGVLPERLTLGADYLYQRSRGDIDVSVASGITPGAPFPDTESKQHNASVHGEYRFTENVSMRVGYLFAWFRQQDWALDGIGPAPGETPITCTGTICAIGSGREAEGYTAHVVSWSLVYRFW